jgi:hypothetical protein
MKTHILTRSSFSKRQAPRINLNRPREKNFFNKSRLSNGCYWISVKKRVFFSCQNCFHALTTLINPASLPKLELFRLSYACLAFNQLCSFGVEIKNPLFSLIELSSDHCLIKISKEFSTKKGKLQK